MAHDFRMPHFAGASVVDASRACTGRRIGSLHEEEAAKAHPPAGRVSEVMLRDAALAYAAVAKLDLSDPRWRRCWRALRRAAIGMVAAIQKAGPPKGYPPS